MEFCIRLGSTGSEDKMLRRLELDYDVDVHVEVTGEVKKVKSAGATNALSALRHCQGTRDL